MNAKLGVISEICCTFAMTIHFRFPQNGPSKAVWGIFLFLMQRYKIFMTLAIKSLDLFELICDYPYTISLKVAKMTKQIGHYTKENGLAENSIQKLLLQLAHNAGSMGFKRQDVYEGLQHVFPSSLTQDEKLRKIGNLLRKIAKEGFITKTISGKQWIITEKGEQELNY